MFKMIHFLFVLVYNESETTRCSDPSSAKTHDICLETGGMKMSIVYEQRPEKLYIGWMTLYPVATHVHSEAELVMQIRGRTLLTIDDMQYELNPGDSAVVFPLVPHSYDRVETEESGGQIAIFPPGIIPEYEGTFHGLLPESPLLPASRANLDLRLSQDRLSRLNMQDNLPLCIAHLHVLLASVLHSLTYRPVYDYNDRDLGHRIMMYISSHACEEITLESASHALGISASHLSHFFSGRMNTNFRRFINAIRIERARLLMRDPNLTLTDICDQCGYTNMRTFRRAFQQELGVLPSEHMTALRQRVTGDRPLEAGKPEEKS